VEILPTLEFARVDDLIVQINLVLDWQGVEVLTLWQLPSTRLVSIPLLLGECGHHFVLNPTNIQDVYLALIADCLSPSGAFISINHERLELGQRSVSKAMKTQTKLVCESRKPSIFLSDYFDEIYRLSK